MAKIDAIEIPKLLFDEGAAPSTPASTNVAVYAKADGLMYSKDDAGTETLMSSGLSAGVASGTSNPGAPASGQQFFRTDLGYYIYYDGTRWLTSTEHAMRMVITDALQATTTSPQNIASAPTDQGIGAMWATRLVCWTLVSTTNNGTNFWTFQLKSRTAGAVATNVGASFNTSADSSGQLVKKTVTIGAAVTSGDTNLVMVATKTLTPGAVYCDAVVFYRLVIT